MALAAAVLRALHDRGSFGWPAGFTPDLDPAEVAAHFSAERCWGGVCAWSIMAHHAAAKERHDPTERLQWARRFGQAARAKTLSQHPEDSGLPGLGVAPPWHPPGGPADGAPGSRRQDPSHPLTSSSSNSSPVFSKGEGS